MSKTRNLSVETAKARVDKLEPHLMQRVWPPMTYMLIPSVLESADALLKQLRRQTAKGLCNADLKVQLERLEALRAEFRREA